MRTLHKSFGFVLAILLAAFAGSSFAAPTKTFYAVIANKTDGCANALATACFNLTVYNVSPNPSTINSLEIVVPQLVNGPQYTILYVAPGSVSQTPGLHGGVVVNSIPGIKNKAPGNSAVFEIDVTITGSTSTCTVGGWGVYANSGNAYPQGDEFTEDTAQSKLSAGSGCEGTGTVACGGSKTLGGGDITSAPGYANLTVSNTLKDGTACVGSMTYGYVNNLTETTGSDAGKLIVVLSNQAAVFSVDIVSVPLANESGWPSKRLKVATQYVSGAWQYVDAVACTGTAVSASSMPDPGVYPQVCVADYTWEATSLGYAKYFARVIGVGNDPAMGWE